MYNRIVIKTNIHCELLLMRNALLPFRNAIENKNKLDAQLITLRSKSIYKRLLFQIQNPESALNINTYLNSFGSIEEQETAFMHKIELEREVKLKEFNFKLLHGFLACNRNLKRWRIKESCVCDICDQSQTIEHLLFGCIYVKPLWKKLNTIYGINITFKQILGLDCTCKHNGILTLLSFLIYKEWLLASLQNTRRCSTLQFEYYKNEISLRICIYKLCKCILAKHVDALCELILRL